MSTATESLSRADQLPEFRKALPTADAIDDEGAKALAAAIIVRAAQDYYDACDQIGLKDIEDILWARDGHLRTALLGDRSEIELFVYSDSCWYELLTTIDRKVFLDKIRRYKMKGHLPTIKNHHKEEIVPPRDDDALIKNFPSKKRNKSRVAVTFRSREYI